MNIYVSNLSFDISNDDLKGFFEEYGEVSSAKVIIDKFTNRSKGFGFVEMPNDEAATKAIQALNGATADNRQIRVSEARPKEDRPASNRNSYSGGGNNGGNNRW
jgi:RNA recognition motif-containing protein